LEVDNLLQENLENCIFCDKDAANFDSGIPLCDEHELELKKRIWKGLGLTWNPETPNPSLPEFIT